MKIGSLCASTTKLMNAKEKALVMTPLAEIDELEGFEVGNTPFIKIENLSDIFGQNHQALLQDFLFMTKDRVSQPLSSSNTVIGRAQHFSCYRLHLPSQHTERTQPRYMLHLGCL